MYVDEWAREEQRLKGAVTRANNAVKAFKGLLADKLKLKAAEAQAREQLRLHRLNRFTAEAEV